MRRILTLAAMFVSFFLIAADHATSISVFEFNRIDGTAESPKAYEGKVLMLVNMA